MTTQQPPPHSVQKPYQQCTKTVMDTIADPYITFDEKGISNYYYEYQKIEAETVFRGIIGRKKLDDEVQKIKLQGEGNKYDCILGISGGVDSSYLAYLAKEEGLRPLVVHFDNGWNSELAVKNIEKIVKKLGFDLYTYVMDWIEFRELQRSYFKASVVDIEIPTDQLIFAALRSIALKMNIKFILSGWNTVTESIMPPSWNFRRKFDAVNMLSIHRRYSNLKFKKLRVINKWQAAYLDLTQKIEIVSLLNYMDYNKKAVKDLLADKLDWKDYGGKHYESVFTRYYQGSYLIEKFNIDKRKAHLSNLICSGQITRDEALNELSLPTYDTQLQIQDKKYVIKKLGFTESEFEDLIKMKRVEHTEFPTEEIFWKRYFAIKTSGAKLKRKIKSLRSLITLNENTDNSSLFPTLK